MLSANLTETINTEDTVTIILAKQVVSMLAKPFFRKQ
jgi:hypothetical protein